VKDTKTGEEEQNALWLEVEKPHLAKGNIMAPCANRDLA
jgi:hypothetical protein